MGNRSSSSHEDQYFEVNLYNDEIEKKLNIPKGENKTEFIWKHVKKQNSEKNIFVNEQPSAPPQPTQSIDSISDSEHNDSESEYDIIDYSSVLEFFSYASPDEYKFAPGTQICVTKELHFLNGMNGLIVDVDLTKSPQKFVVYLQNGKLTYLSKDEFSVEDSEFKISQKQIKTWSMNLVRVPRQRNRQISWWKSIWNRNKENNEKIKKNDLKLSQIDVQKFDPPKNLIISNLNLNLEPSAPPSPISIQIQNFTNSNETIQRDKNIYQKEQPLVSVFESRAQRNAKRSPRQLRHLPRRAMNESQLMNRSALYDESMTMMQSSIILPPSFQTNSKSIRINNSQSQPQHNCLVDSLLAHDSIHNTIDDINDFSFGEHSDNKNLNTRISPSNFIIEEKQSATNQKTVKIKQKILIQNPI